VVETAPAVTTARTLTNTDGCLVWQNGDGVSANPILNIDPNCILTFSSGTADPPATCTPPEVYYETDVFEFSICANTDSWEFLITQNAQTDDAVIVGSGSGYALKVLPNGPVSYATSGNTFSKFAGLYSHATDCTSLTTGIANDICIELDSEDLYSCQPAAGGCDTAGEWILSGDGTGGSAATSLTEIHVFDEFIGGVNAITGDSTFLPEGSLGWRTSIGTTCVLAPMTATGSANHPGILVMTTGANDNVLCSIHGFLQTATEYGGSDDWEAVWIFRLPAAITSTYLRLGLYTTNNVTQTGGIGYIYDTDAGHTNGIFQVCDSSTTGCQSAGDDTNADTVASTSTLTANTWHAFKIRYDATGVGGNPTYYMSIGISAAYETEKTFCSSGCDEDLGNLPTGALFVGAMVAARAAATTKDLEMDYFQYDYVGLVRF
jgi:hypothetical protein